jgi:cyclase
MLTKRIIPCLDIKDGRTVKGINFEQIRDAGDPVELAALYAQQGADELVFLDITATVERRKTLSELVNKIAHKINIPFTVGGGIQTEEDVSILLQNGADKISVNSAAFKNPSIIQSFATNFGSQCVVLAIDAKCEEDGRWYVYLNGGRVKTELKTIDWAKEGVELGAGEILLTSMNNDGTKDGFAIDITKQISEAVNVPVIASGGAGNMQHFEDVFKNGKADAALAASVFHYKEIAIPELKKYLKDKSDFLLYIIAKVFFLFFKNFVSYKNTVKIAGIFGKLLGKLPIERKDYILNNIKDCFPDLDEKAVKKIYEKSCENFVRNIFDFTKF